MCVGGGRNCAIRDNYLLDFDPHAPRLAEYMMFGEIQARAAPTREERGRRARA